MQAQDDQQSPATGIDPARLQLALEVLAEVEALPLEHPDAIAVQRATAGIYKTVRKAAPPRAARRDPRARPRDRRRDRDRRPRPDRRRDGGPAALDRDRARGRAAPARCSSRSPVTSARSTSRRSTTGTTSSVRAARRRNHQRRDARTDLTGRRALLTGGRAKIGMYIALRLLRDGAHTTITTRFPNDAIRRFKAMEDSDEWIHRLRIVGIDLRDPSPGDRARRRRRRRGTARHPHQQRRSDGPPLAGGVRAAGRGRARAAAARRAAAAGHLRPGRERAADLAAGGDRVRPALGAHAARADRDGAAGRTRPRWTASPSARRSTRAASCPTCTTPTAGSRRSTRSTRPRCWRSSSAT